MNGPSSPPPTVLVAIALSVLLLVGAGVGLALADSGYNLDVPGSIDTPEQTVTVEGDEYDVDAIASLTAGEHLDVDVTMPDDDSFRVDLYNSDRQVEDFRRGSGSERVTFETDDLTPGSYVLALSVDSNHVELHPVVIEAYDVSLDSIDDVETDEVLEVTVNVAKIDADEPPAGVEVAVWNGETVTREEATGDGDGTYIASFASGAFDEGTYEVYAVAQGSDTVDGEPEPLGVSEQEQVTVSEPEADDGGDEDETDEDGNGDESDDESGDETNESDDEIDDPANETEDDSTNDTADDVEDPDDDSVDGTDESDAEDESGDGSDESDESDEPQGETDDDDDAVIEPSQEEPDPESEDDASDAVPLYAPAVILGALLAIGIAVRASRG